MVIVSEKSREFECNILQNKFILPVFSWRPSNQMQRNLTRLYVLLSEASDVIAPACYHIDMFLNPCLPIHLGTQLLLEEHCKGGFSMDISLAWSFNALVRKLALLTFSLFNWTFLISGCSFQVSIGLLLKCHCLRNYIDLAMHTLQQDQTIKTCMIYRELQIMNALYREIYSRYMTLVVLACVVGLHIISVYACIKFGTQLPLPMVLAFTNVAVIAMFVIVYIFSCLADVFVSSKKLLIDCKSLRPDAKTRGMSHFWFKRFTASCRVLRIYIGHTNYVDEFTPLVVEDFVASQTAGLMCM